MWRFVVFKEQLLSVQAAIHLQSRLGFFSALPLDYPLF
jgi:hypothetical protein